MTRLLALVTLMLLGLSLGGCFTHLLQAGAKANLGAADFLLLQQNLFGPAGSSMAWVEAFALLTLAATAYLGREAGAFFHLGLVVFGCLAAMLAIWILWVHPVNLLIDSWRPHNIPAKWTDARDIWHTLHAIRFVLACVALAAYGWGILCLGRTSRRRFGVHLTPAMEQAIKEAQGTSQTSAKEDA